MYLILLYSSNTFSQSQNWWKIDGNSNGSSTSFIGTTNNFSLRFRANNTEWFSISPSGQYTFNGLTGTSNGLMLISNTGNVYRLNFSGNGNEVLTAAGNWQNVSNLIPQYWQLNNNTLISNYNVGIGTTVAPEKLTVNGNILANGSISGTSLNVVDITTTGREFKVSNTLCIKGYDPQDPTSKNHICGTNNDLYIQSTSGNYNTIINHNNQGKVGIGTDTPITTLDVNGSARFSDKIYAKRLTAKPGDSLIYIGDSSMIFHALENRISWTNTCYISTSDPNIFIGGYCRGFAIGNGNTYAKGVNSIAIGNNVQTAYVPPLLNGLNAIVIGSGVDSNTFLTNPYSNSLMLGFNSNIPTLFVSSSSGSNTSGKVSIGDISHTRILSNVLQAKLNVIGETPDILFDAKSMSNQTVVNNFTVYGNGKVGIGIDNTNMPGNYSLYVKSGILTERVRVALSNDVQWQDVVFEPNYTLMPLDSVEMYVKKNCHLPGIPSADDVTKNGIDVAQMDAAILGKTEELFLYLFELKKQIQIMQKEIDSLKTENNKLKTNSTKK